MRSHAAKADRELPPLPALAWLSMAPEIISGRYDKILNTTHQRLCDSDATALRFRDFFDSTLAAKYESKITHEMCNMALQMFEAVKAMVAGMDNLFSEISKGIVTSGKAEMMKSLGQLPEERIEVLKCHLLTVFRYHKLIAQSDCSFQHYVKDLHVKVLGWVYEYVVTQSDSAIGEENHWLNGTAPVCPPVFPSKLVTYGAHLVAVITLLVGILGSAAFLHQWTRMRQTAKVRPLQAEVVEDAEDRIPLNVLTTTVAGD